MTERQQKYFQISKQMDDAFNKGDFELNEQLGEEFVKNKQSMTLEE